jgi:hypothetical protein
MCYKDWQLRADDPKTLAAYGMITEAQVHLERIEKGQHVDLTGKNGLGLGVRAIVLQHNQQSIRAIAEAQAPAWHHLGSVLGEVASRRAGRPIEVKIKPYGPSEHPGDGAVMAQGMAKGAVVYLDGKLLDGPYVPHRGIERWRTRMGLVLAVLEHECCHILYDPKNLDRGKGNVPLWQNLFRYCLWEGRMEREAVSSGVKGRRERLRLAFAGVVMGEMGNWLNPFDAGEHFVFLVSRIVAGVIDEKEVPAALALLSSAVGKTFAAKAWEAAEMGVALPRRETARMTEIAAGIGGPPKRLAPRERYENLVPAANAEMARLATDGLRAIGDDVRWVEEVLRGVGSKTSDPSL